MNKKKIIIKRALLTLSISITVAIIAYNVYLFIFGIDIYTWIKPVYVRTDYGFDALKNLLNICVLYPILGINTICQIVYIVIKKIKSNKNKV